MTEWRNRIVSHGEEAPDQLLANPRNWRAVVDALGGVPCYKLQHGFAATDNVALGVRE